MRAVLRDYRQSPRKVRLVADLVRGKDVDQALLELEFVGKRAAHAISKLIKSAVANAKEKNNLSADSLVIDSILVDEGRTLKRLRPMSRGRAFRIRKRTSHVTIELAPKKEAIVATQEKTSTTQTQTEPEDKDAPASQTTENTEQAAESSNKTTEKDQPQKQSNNT